MELTANDIRKAAQKRNTIKWLKAQPEDTTFEPASPCRCMYGKMFTEQFGGDYEFFLDFEEVVVKHVGKRAVVDIADTFADHFQQRACGYMDDRNDRLRESERTEYITRDEAIFIARSTPA